MLATQLSLWSMLLSLALRGAFLHFLFLNRVLKHATAIQILYAVSAYNKTRHVPTGIHLLKTLYC